MRAVKQGISRKVGGLNFSVQKFQINLNIGVDRDLLLALRNLSARTGRSVTSIARKTLYKIFLNKNVE